MAQQMAKTEQPLYPKISSIYNKIMQLAIAICLIIVLMNLWMFSYSNNQQATQKHFNLISKQYLAQVTSTIKILVRNNSKDIQAYFDEISQSPWLKDISLYDPTGQLLFASQTHISMNDLFGISINKADRSQKYSTFVNELRTDSLQGYIRITIDNNSFTQNIEQASAQHYDLVRFMMIIAVVVGFFLTRGLNRFSRQGYRLAYSK
ncbi:AhpA/YtjB family protein [Colwelliaceae bacterium 6441]